MRKAISIFLSVLMLASSSGVAYAQHYCEGMEIMSQLTIGEAHLSCEMGTSDLSDDCEVEGGAAETQGCCQNQVSKIQIDDNFAKASFSHDLDQVFVATHIPVIAIQEVEISLEEKNFFVTYNPPPLERDLNILYETFLI